MTLRRKIQIYTSAPLAVHPREITWLSRPARSDGRGHEVLRPVPGRRGSELVSAPMPQVDLGKILWTKGRDRKRREFDAVTPGQIPATPRRTAAAPRLGTAPQSRTA